MGNKTLLENAVYKRYTELLKLPAGTPELSPDGADSGCTIHAGELFCRALWESGDDELCGKKFSDRGAVIHHLKVFHPQYQLSSAQTGRSSYQRQQSALRFYKDVMAIHGRIDLGKPGENAFQTHLPERPREAAPLQTPTALTQATGNGTQEERVSNVLPTTSAAVPTPPAPKNQKRKRALSQSSKKVRLRRPAKKDLLPVPLYNLNNPKKGQVKGQPNINSCRRILKSNGLPVVCERCKAEGRLDCSFEQGCGGRSHFKF
ncbi:hypothetical protein K469DRAFT_715007 [Zopfia rhizophila CBS 207.26]|uniref:Uncharacterized protein n=1 Tax=Zopfia rhizophila CBS 207.26 TaxID=1314779 RepID=A0A6A6ELE2_9PEZI|nr:hypothetical protein K469DRAFT_715007 [Zopfia rhizophila CBS 207.26]